ncbi:MAG: glucose dehydrogenase [Solirubrobacterales bacterium]|nr:glucose dehydrogenase [Solirubrobacterales bacterium]
MNPAMKRLLLPLTMLTALIVAVPAAGTPPVGDGDDGVTLTELDDFNQPIFATSAPGAKGLLFVVEKQGRVMVMRKGETLARPFVDLSSLVDDGGERGLLSIAFHPGYDRNRLLYAYYTQNDGDNVVVELRRSAKKPTVVAPGSIRDVIEIPHPDDAANHNGGQIEFGPDGLLYIASGDGGSTPEAAQDRDNLRGKVLRIEPRKSRRKGGGSKPYTSPRSNPFAGPAPGRAEVYSLGLRNPYRFSFDRLTGALLIGDVGEGQREEVDFRKRGKGRGANFGWPRFEGSLLRDGDISAPGAILPIHDYDHSSRCAIIGGYVVRDKRLESLYGRYVYSDLCDGIVRSLIPKASGAVNDQEVGPGTFVDSPGSFGQGKGGRIFVASLAGPLYRLDPAP